MGLAERLGSAATRAAPSCPVSRLMAALSDVDRVALQRSLEDGLLSNNAIIVAVRRENLHLSRDSLASHRKGECNCGTSGST